MLLILKMLEVSPSDKSLIFGNQRFLPAIRKLYDMKEVIYDENWLSKAENLDLYYMYRDLYLTKKDYESIKERNLRYDITIIPACMLGQEYVKTAGHYHPSISVGINITYPEIYGVLSGEAHYILQKVAADTVEDVVLIEAKQNDIVLIPPNYGHITINPSTKTLEMANLVERNFSSIYEPIKAKRGGAYFELTGRKFIKNRNYSDVPELRVLKPASYYISELKSAENLYSLIRDKFLECLRKPIDYSGIFDRILRG